MTQSNWTSGFETGLAELDDDHRQLLDKANRVIRASSDIPLGELSAALSELNEEMKAHFAREERLMDEFKYQASGEHGDEHQQLLADIREKLDAIEDFRDNVSNYGHYVHGWIGRHIVGKDMLFGRAVQAGVGAVDRRQRGNVEFDAIHERRLDNLEAMLWPDNIATGIAEIDDDYPTLIELLNQIVDARKSADRHRLGELFERFGNTIAAHFDREEALMSSIESEHNETHRDEHRKLLDEFAQLVDDWGSDRISAELLCRFIYRWILRHISTSDIPLGKALARQAI